jgi:hypothetical protein
MLGLGDEMIIQDEILIAKSPWSESETCDAE